MPRPPEDVRRRIEELIARCDNFLPPRPREETPREAVRFSAPVSDQWRFVISSLQTLRSACGADSPHHRELERCREKLITEKTLDLDTCRGALEAARDDLDAGMLTDLRQLVTSETFGDLLEAASHLSDEGYQIPAVALAGAVLESSLRALAASKHVVWNGSSGISKINTALYSASVYDKVVHGEVEAWGKLRNHVDHGEYNNPNDVDRRPAARMVEGVRDFVLKYR